jgi:hypothetical protein
LHAPTWRWLVQVVDPSRVARAHHPAVPFLVPAPCPVPAEFVDASAHVLARAIVHDPSHRKEVTVMIHCVLAPARHLDPEASQVTSGVHCPS